MTALASLTDPASIGGDAEPAPVHVAIIMDGNGRWAAQRGLPRSAGHERGVEALRRCVKAAGELGITHLTVYSFSTENWRRPASEVNALFGLLRAYVRRDLNRLHDEGVRIRIVGRRADVPQDILESLEHAEALTADNQRFTLVIAFNYGSREEMIRAVRRAMDAAVAGELSPEDLTEETFEGFLDTAGVPDPELLIRTSGERRISNFLLWQIAYSELVFLDVLWPDFEKAHLEEALEEFRKRDRRYGGLGLGTP